MDYEWVGGGNERSGVECVRFGGGGRGPVEGVRSGGCGL